MSSVKQQELWLKSIELFKSQLTKDEKKIKLATLQGSFSDLVKDVQALHGRVEDSRFPWTANIQKTIDHINRYAALGDIIIQQQTEYTSLVWGTIRFLLLFAAEEPKTTETITRGLPVVTQAVFRAEEYSKLFSTPPDSSTSRVFWSLQDSLTHLYAEVLSFLIRSTIFFQKPTFRRYISAGTSSDTKIRSILENIDKYERSVEKDKNLLESEDRKRKDEYENGLWLQAADFKADLKKREEDYRPGTCAWFLNSEEYKHFKETQSGSQHELFLWINGKPGCGKSILAAQIIKNLQSSKEWVTYVLCKAGQQNKNTLDAILRNLLFQLLEMPNDKGYRHRLLLNTRRNIMKESTQSVEALWTLLARILSQMDRVFFVLDGLDECDCSRSERQAFIKQLTQAFKTQSSNARIISISQVELTEAEINEQGWRTMSIRTADVQEDISNVVESDFESSRVLASHPEKPRLVKTVVQHSDGMMLWARLMTQELEKEQWNPDETFKNLPHGLSALYKNILHRILKDQNIESHMHRALRFVLAATRPLTFSELALCIAVSSGLKQHEDYDTRGRPTDEAKEIITTCSPLIVAMSDGTVQIVHSSFREFLFSAVTPTSFSLGEEECQSLMASTLTKYLSFDCFAIDPYVWPRREHFLLNYSVKNLLEHYLKVKAPTAPDQLASFLVSRYGWRWEDKLAAYHGMHSYVHRWQLKMVKWSQNSTAQTRSILCDMQLAIRHTRYEELKMLDEGNDSRILAKHLLASAYGLRGQLRKAVGMFEELLERDICSAQDKYQHKDMLLLALAEAYTELNKLEEAERLQLQILESIRPNKEKEPIQWLHIACDLGATYRYQGRLDEAMALISTTLDLVKKLVGEEHPLILVSVSQLALCYEYQGKLEEAETIQTQALEKLKHDYGDGHPSILDAQYILSGIYSKQGRYNESAIILEQTAEMQRLIVGNDSPATLNTLERLGFAYKETGRIEEARSLWQELHQRTESNLGSEHPKTVYRKALLKGLENLDISTFV